MSNDRLTGVLAEVDSIGKDAQALVAELQPKAQEGKSLTQAELAKVKALVGRADAAMAAAEERAKERREARIQELEELVKNINISLATPGLSTGVVNDLKRMKRNKLAQLTRLKTRAALDFGGVLSATEVQEIADVLAEAKAAVAGRKKAAGFLGSILKIASLAVSITGKVGALI